MKNLKLIIIVFALTLLQVSASAQEKKIKFSKGTLQICSSKNFQITGYDGDEVIIKSLHENRMTTGLTTTVTGQAQYSYSNALNLARVNKKKDSTKKGNLVYFFGDENRKKGLKKLGKKYENSEYGIYFTIEQKDGELIFRDNTPKKGQFVIFGNEKYEIKIPNSIKLNWKTNLCEKTEKRNQRNTIFYNSNPSSLSNFNGEVEIESTLHNIKLLDVTGPVSINTVGGNVTVDFDKKNPQQLYSIYSNNGFIDFKIPENSSITGDVTGKSVYSDVDFKVLDEKDVDDFGHTKTVMKLKLGSGKVKIKLDAGYGNIYLRKK